MVQFLGSETVVGRNHNASNERHKYFSDNLPKVRNSNEIFKHNIKIHFIKSFNKFINFVL